MRRWVDGFLAAGYGCYSGLSGCGMQQPGCIPIPLCAHTRTPRYHTMCLLGTEQPEYTTLPSFWEEEVRPTRPSTAPVLPQ